MLAVPVLPALRDPGHGSAARRAYPKVMPEPLPDELADEVARVADQASIGLIRFDPQLRVRTANLAAHHALERRSGSLVGRSVMETFVDHRLEAIVRAAAHGQSGSYESEAPDRASLVVRAGAAIGGGAWVTIENITELQSLRRIRSEFIDNLSHELRTPLANVRLLTEMLTDDLAKADVPERVRERVATIDVETGHLVQMINELLDLTRMEHAVVRVRHDELRPGPAGRGRHPPTRDLRATAGRHARRGGASGAAAGARRRGAPGPAADEPAAQCHQVLAPWR